MTAVLAFEASTFGASVALCRGDGTSRVRRQPAGERGTAFLALAAADLLREQGLRPADLLGVAVGTGPGSYTGLRASIALARGLAFGAGLPLAGIPSSAAAAWAALGGDPVRRDPSAPSAAAHGDVLAGADIGAGADVRRVVVAIDARRDESYRADYERDADGAAPRVAREPCLVPTAEIVALLDALPEGWRLLREPVPAADVLAELARPVLVAGGHDADHVRPLYLKRSHAEIQVDERR